MPNPPYSGGVIIIRENQDGLDARVFHWSEITPSTPIPKGLIGAQESMLATGPDLYTERMCATRSDLIAKFTQYVNAMFPDTSA